MKKLILVWIILLAAVAGAGCSGEIKYKVLDRVTPEQVLFYYVHEETRKDGHVNQYLMAYTTDYQIVPVLVLNKASYLSDLYEKDGKIYLYNDRKTYFYNDTEETFDRTLTSFDIQTRKVKVDNKTGNKEGNYYFSQDTLKLNEINAIGPKVKSVVEKGDSILVQYETNKMAILNQDQSISQEIVMKQYTMIFYVLPYQNDIIIVGTDKDKSILIMKLDWNLQVLQKTKIKEFDDVTLCTGNDVIYGIAKKVEKESIFFIIDKNWEISVLDEDFPGESLLYIGKQNQVVYFNKNKDSYIFLNDKGIEVEEKPVIFKEDKYHFPDGKIYIE